MLRQINCDDYREIASLLKRKVDQQLDVEDRVKDIIANVRRFGDQALIDYNLKFDGAITPKLLVSEEEIDEAVKNTDPNFYRVMEDASKNIYDYHSRQKKSGYVYSRGSSLLGQVVTPLDRVGVYIPGGTAVYPSSVLMNVIPAKIAGVGEIIMVTPPNREGKVDEGILAAAHIAGVTTIFKVGGAQSIAALAYGTKSIPKVDKITGPGNIYVATAKKQVFGVVDIDMIAGPSEILIIADDSANPRFVAADLLSQAEHDKLAAVYLVTTSKTLGEKVLAEIEQMLKTISRSKIASESLKNNGYIITTNSMENAVEISNEIAPEHLEVCTVNPFEVMAKVRHAGSVFLGNYSPEALGDYLAGPNHTLPTSGTARFSSGLSVEDFQKKSSFIYYSKEDMQRVAEDVNLFATKEGLDAHGLSAIIRKEEEL